MLSVFFTTFSYCVSFIPVVEVYAVLIKVYIVFFGKSGWL